MMLLRHVSTITILLFATVLCFAQGGISNQKSSPSNEVGITQKSTPAYAEVLLKRTELEAELESLLVEYTEEYPKIKQDRYELGMIAKESERIVAVKPADAGKLTAALGKLIVRKVELEGDLWNLQQQFGDAHPDVKRAKRKVEIFEKAIREILG